MASPSMQDEPLSRCAFCRVTDVANGSRTSLVRGRTMHTISNEAGWKRFTALSPATAAFLWQVPTWADAGAAQCLNSSVRKHLSRREPHKRRRLVRQRVAETADRRSLKLATPRPHHPAARLGKEGHLVPSIRGGRSRTRRAPISPSRREKWTVTNLLQEPTWSQHNPFYPSCLTRKSG